MISTVSSEAMPDYSSQSSEPRPNGAAAQVSSSAGTPAAAADSGAATTPNDAASVSGGVARAAGVVGTHASRILGSLFRVPIKAFRQNKFDFAEGHQPLHPPAAASAGVKPVKPLKLLMDTQGRGAVVVKQILPSLVGNVVVGSLMFSSFDHTIAALSSAAERGSIPRWMCSTTLSTGLPAPPADSHQAHSLRQRLKTAFLRPHTGIDVFLAGAVAGATSSIVTTTMENSATVMRIQYQKLAAAAAASQAPSVAPATSAPPAGAPSVPPRVKASANALEAVVIDLMPPSAPRQIATLNLAAILREMLTSTAAPGVPSLFSHLTFRMTREAIGLGAFFWTFEALHAQMRVVPYRWMESQEISSGATPSKAPSAPNQPPASPSVHAPPPALLGSLLAWEVVSVVTSGMLAGLSYHTVSFPFFRALQRMETRVMNLQSGATTNVPGAPASMEFRGAWSELVHIARTKGLPGLFHGLLGETSLASAGPIRRVQLINPLVFGLVAYTLTKSEQHAHQWRTWKEERHREKYRLYRP